MLVLLALLVWCCYTDPANAVSDDRQHETSLRTYCQWTRDTVDLWGIVAKYLPYLRDDIEDSLTPSEWGLISDIKTIMPFLSDQSMSSLIYDLAENWNHLLCMGRAMDIKCLGSHCPYYTSPRLYWPHLLPDNVKRLSSQRRFRQTYHDILDNFGQLIAALDGRGNIRRNNSCESWRGNSAIVLILSFASINIAQTLADAVIEHCQELESDSLGC